jgi:hypothetical protein
LAVYLDTNVLAARVGFESVQVNASLAVCRERGLEVVLPALVLDELESHRLRSIEASFDAVVAAHKTARSYAHIPAPDFPNPSALAAEYRRALLKHAGAAATPPDAPAEALRRETFRIPPARDGSGARDAAIWLTVREDHLARSEDGYFVSNNTRDFGAAGKPVVLSQHLANEVSSHEHPLYYFDSLASLVNELATTIDPLFEDGDELLKLADFGKALSAATSGSEFLSQIDRPDELGAGGKLFLSAAPAIVSLDVRDIRGYEIEGTKISTSLVLVEGDIELGTVRSSGPGLSQTVVRVRCSIATHLWMKQDAASSPVVEISRIGSVRTLK